MNCIDAQTAISDALDRIPVDASVLEEAKEHCRSCAECGAFVRALSIVKRAPLPEPPADLSDRVMAAVRAQAARDVAARESTAAAAAQAAALAAETNPEGFEPDATSPLDLGREDGAPAEVMPLATHAPTRPRMTRRATMSAWAAAAALFIVTVTALTINGVQSISRAPQLAENSSFAGKTSGGAPTASDQSALAGKAGVAGGQAPAAAAGGPSYVTVDGQVFKLVGPDSTSRSGLKNVGQTTTALSGSTPSSREVLQGSDATQIFIADDTGQLLAFTRVTRDYGGRDYGLVSKHISQFGTWPSLPASVPEPPNPDGSPTFTMLGKDDTGLTVYGLASTDGAAGIAVGPGTDPSDPANGDPNWTWWTPLP